MINVNEKASMSNFYKPFYFYNKIHYKYTEELIKNIAIKKNSEFLDKN